MNDELRAFLAENNCLLVDGYDHCVAAHTYYPVKAVYSVVCILGTLMHEGMSEEEAWEHFTFNIVGARPNEDNAPVFMYDVEMAREYTQQKMDDLIETTENILRRSPQ